MKAIAVCILASATAFAEPSAAQRASQLYQSAVKHYRLHELDAAAVEFKASFEIVPRPPLLFNLAQTYRQLGRNADALFLYRQYLATAPVSASERRTIGERMAELRALIDGQRAVENAPPVDAEPKAEAAPVVVVAPAPAEPMRLVAIVGKPPAPAYRSAAGWALLGGGLAIAGGGAAMLARGIELDGQISGVASLVDAGQLGAERDRYRPAGIALLAVGGAAAVCGVVVFIVTNRRSHLLTVRGAQ